MSGLKEIYSQFITDVAANFPVDVLLPQLVSQNIIKTHELQHIQCQKYSAGRRRVLFTEIIASKELKCHPELINFLREHNYNDQANFLESRIFKDTKIKTDDAQKSIRVARMNNNDATTNKLATPSCSGITDQEITAKFATCLSEIYSQFITEVAVNFPVDVFLPQLVSQNIIKQHELEHVQCQKYSVDRRRVLFSEIIASKESKCHPQLIKFLREHNYSDQANFLESRIFKDNKTKTDVPQCSKNSITVARKNNIDDAANNLTTPSFTEFLDEEITGKFATCLSEIYSQFVVELAVNFPVDVILAQLVLQNIISTVEREHVECQKYTVDRRRVLFTEIIASKSTKCHRELIKFLREHDYTAHANFLESRIFTDNKTKTDEAKFTQNSIRAARTNNIDVASNNSTRPCCCSGFTEQDIKFIFSTIKPCFLTIATIGANPADITALAYTFMESSATCYCTAKIIERSTKPDGQTEYGSLVNRSPAFFRFEVIADKAYKRTLVKRLGSGIVYLLKDVNIDFTRIKGLKVQLPVTLLFFNIDNSSSLITCSTMQIVSRLKVFSVPFYLIGMNSHLRKSACAANKSNLLSFDVCRAKAENMGAIAYMECSSETGENVNNLFVTVLRKAIELDRNN